MQCCIDPGAAKKEKRIPMSMIPLTTPCRLYTLKSTMFVNYKGQFYGPASLDDSKVDPRFEVTCVPGPKGTVVATQHRSHTKKVVETWSLVDINA